MATLAFGGFAGLLAAAFGWRTVLHRRRTGMSGWLAPPTPAAWVGDGLFTAGALAALAAPGLDLTGILRPAPFLDRRPIKVCGAVLLAAGAALALGAQAQMGATWRAGIDLADDQLVTQGPFRLMRNPFYTGMTVASVGVAIMVPNLAALTGIAALAAGSQIDARLVEEPHLRATHGATYDAYATAVPRFLPRLRGKRCPGTCDCGGGSRSH